MEAIRCVQDHRSSFNAHDPPSFLKLCDQLIEVQVKNFCGFSRIGQCYFSKYIDLFVYPR
jgi:hypothetical protein